MTLNITIRQLQWNVALITNIWHVQNRVTGEKHEALFENKAHKLATRLNIKQLANYASVGEFNWVCLTVGNYRHAAMPMNSDPYFTGRTLCDKTTRGIAGMLSGLGYCPECLKEIKVMNGDFEPQFDPICLYWYLGETDMGIIAIRFNNDDYARHIKERV